MYEALICDFNQLEKATLEHPVKGVVQQVSAFNIAEALVAFDLIIKKEEVVEKLNSFGISNPIILDILDSTQENKVVYSHEVGFIGLDKC